MNTEDLEQKPLRCIGLIGDIHAEDGLLELALDHALAQGVDQILATGDVVDGCGSVDRCCELLRARGVVVVRGNHERWILTGAMRDLPEATQANSVSKSAIDYLASLPATIEISTVRGPALLCHGLGDADMASVGPDDEGYGLEVNAELNKLIDEGRYKIVMNGHTHQRMVRRFGRGLTIVNAGTLKHDQEPGFVLVDFEIGTVTWMRIDGSTVSIGERWSIRHG